MAYTAAVQPETDIQSIRRGILYVLGAVLVFSAVNVLVKWTVAEYPINEVLFFRNAFALIPAIALVAANGGLKSLRTARPAAHLLRGLLGVGAMAALFLSFQMMPLADATAISFVQPLFLTALSVPFLGEQVGKYRWSAVIVGFIGVLVMIQPGAGSFDSGAAVGLISAFLMAGAFVLVRRLSTTESSSAIVFYFAVISTLATAVALPLGWRTPTLPDFFLLALLGLAGGTGQFLMTQAFRLAPAAVIAPFNYTSMIWAALFGFLIWGDLPTAALLFGGSIVIASGLYILYRETYRRADTVLKTLRSPGGN